MPRKTSSSFQMLTSRCAAVCLFRLERQSWKNGWERGFSNRSASTQSAVARCPRFPVSKKLSKRSIPSATRNRATFLRSGTMPLQTASSVASASCDGSVGSSAAAFASCPTSTSKPCDLRKRRRFSAFTLHISASSCSAAWRRPSGHIATAHCTMSNRSGIAPSVPNTSAISGAAATSMLRWQSPASTCTGTVQLASMDRSTGTPPKLRYRSTARGARRCSADSAVDRRLEQRSAFHRTTAGEVLMSSRCCSSIDMKPAALAASSTSGSMTAPVHATLQHNIFSSRSISSVESAHGLTCGEPSHTSGAHAIASTASNNPAEWHVATNSGDASTTKLMTTSTLFRSSLS
mmetsp:Transcript_3484/g.9717  ORF Transcript_3484/g.9717 Transcript_3484/m.9717 type:complete len:348 (-) Transcript_3484:1176-2219(-)